MLSLGRPIIRLASAVAVLLVFLILVNIFEVRKTAYSCRTFWSCVGLTGWQNRFYKSQDRAKVQYAETILRDGTVRFERRHSSSDATVLILVLSRDNSSWSSDFRSSQRSIHDLLEILVSTQVDLSTVSLSLMTDSIEEYRSIVAVADKLALSRTSVFLRKHTEEKFSYQNRHNPQVQLARRSHIATIRNYLMSRALEDEQHIIWLDADVVELSPRIIQTMIRHSENHAEAGIITAECHQNQMDNYDKNAWKVQSPSLADVVPESDRGGALERLVAERLMVPDVIRNTTDTDLLPLDSVGGTILYIRASLVRQGLAFPHFNMVGTTWKQPGWIGVETEGICYAARGLEGGNCFVLGGQHHIRHTDWG